VTAIKRRAIAIARRTIAIKHGPGLGVWDRTSRRPGLEGKAPSGTPSARRPRRRTPLWSCPSPGTRQTQPRRRTAHSPDSTHSGHPRSACKKWEWAWGNARSKRAGRRRGRTSRPPVDLAGSRRRTAHSLGPTYSGHPRSACKPRADPRLFPRRRSAPAEAHERLERDQVGGPASFPAPASAGSTLCGSRESRGPGSVLQAQRPNAQSNSKRVAKGRRRPLYRGSSSTRTRGSTTGGRVRSASGSPRVRSGPPAHDDRRAAATTASISGMAGGPSASGRGIIVWGPS
jgi:hypothetical protein